MDERARFETFCMDPKEDIWLNLSRNSLGEYIYSGTKSALRIWRSAVEREREACAIECDRMVSASSIGFETGSACAAAIRARGGKK